MWVIPFWMVVFGCFPTQSLDIQWYPSILTDVYPLRKLPEFLTAKPSEEAKEEVKKQLLQVRTTWFGGSLHWIAPWYIDMIAHDTPWTMGEKLEFDGIWWEVTTCFFLFNVLIEEYQLWGMRRTSYLPEPQVIASCGETSYDSICSNDNSWVAYPCLPTIISLLTI